MERQIDFLSLISGVTTSLNEVSYNNGDISDIGNEIGFALGKYLENMTQEEINNFIMGIKHGISLTNNTH